MGVAKAATGELLRDVNPDRKQNTLDSDNLGPPSKTRFGEVENGRRLAALESARKPDHASHGWMRQYCPTGMHAKKNAPDLAHKRGRVRVGRNP